MIHSFRAAPIQQEQGYGLGCAIVQGMSADVSTCRSKVQDKKGLASVSMIVPRSSQSNVPPC